MDDERRATKSERWFRLLLGWYPSDFREELGDALVETYIERAAAARRRGGGLAVAGVWLRALSDSVRNGLAERFRPAVSWRRSGNWGRDTELVVRRLVRAPAFTLAMIGTLMVGLGAFAVVYTVVNRVLLAPLPYAEPDDLYYVWRDYTTIFPLDRGWLAGTDVVALDTLGGVIEGAAGLARGTATLSGTVDGEPEQIFTFIITPNLFDVLGVHPALGRGFAPDEVGPGREPLIVLTHELWRRTFNSDPGVLGREVRLNGNPFTVIGVMGPDVPFVVHSSLGSPQVGDAYTTFTTDLAETNPGAGSYAGMIRARAGTHPAQVASAVEALGAALDERDHDARGIRLYPVGMKADLIAPVRPALVVLGLAGVFLLLVLAVNLATLLLTRAAQREREFAVSRALGANRIALVRAMLLEGGLLGMLGGVAGAAAAVWGTRLLVGIAPLDLPRRESIIVDWQIAAVVVLVGTVLGLAAGVLPATWASRTRLETLLGNAAVRGGGGHGRLRRGMVVVQVALSLVLLSAGALVVRSFDGLLRAQPGFDAAGVLTFRVLTPQALYPDAAAVDAGHERIEMEVGALPGVRALGSSTVLPLTALGSQTRMYIAGAPGNTGDDELDRPLVDWAPARPGYFEALGMRVLAGRTFEGALPAGASEAVIDHLIAERFFPGADPVGSTLQLGGDSLRIVGVVQHARRYDVHEDGRPQVYVHSESLSPSLRWYALRTDRTPTSLIPEVRAAIRRVDAELAMAEVRTMEQVVGDSLRQQRLSAVLIGGFSLGALLLAAMGLFGVVSGSVTRRRQELAVRLALGATHGRVVRLVLGEGARLIALGLLIGVPGIYMSGQAIRGVLVGVSPFDAPTLIAVAIGLGLVAITACYIPARRVTRIEPSRMLREEG